MAAGDHVSISFLVFLVLFLNFVYLGVCLSIYIYVTKSVLMPLAKRGCWTFPPSPPHRPGLESLVVVSLETKVLGTQLRP